jgi:hypothetical protein
MAIMVLDPSTASDRVPRLAPCGSREDTIEIGLVARREQP